MGPNSALSIGISSVYTNFSLAIDCLNMLQSMTSDKDCYAYYLSIGDPQYYAAAIALNALNMTYVDIEDPSYKTDGELFTRLRNGTIDVSFDYAGVTADRFDEFTYSHIISTVDICVLRLTPLHAWYEVDFERIAGGLGRTFLLIILGLMTVLYTIHSIRESSFFNHSCSVNDGFSFVRQAIPSHNSQSPRVQTGVTRKCITFSMGVLTFAIAFVQQSGLQQSLLIGRTTSAEQFIERLLADLEANRTRIAFEAEGSATEFQLRSMTDSLSRRLIASLDDNPALYAAPLSSVTSRTHPVAMLSAVHRLNAFITTMSDDECPMYSMETWPHMPTTINALPMSRRIEADKRELVNRVVTERFPLMEALERNPPSMSDACRRHFFPTPNSVHIAYHALDWHTVSGVFFASVFLNVVAVGVLLVERFNHKRADVVDDDNPGSRAFARETRYFVVNARTKGEASFIDEEMYRLKSLLGVCFSELHDDESNEGS